MADEKTKGLSDWLDGVESGQPVQSPINMPAETGMASGQMGFLESLRRPGYGTNAPADLTKILAQVGSDTAGGGLYGGLLSALSGAINPDSIRPAIGAGNLTSAITGKINKIPGVNKLPGFLQQAIAGGAQGAADAADSGNDVGVAAGVGAAGGGLLGGLASHMQNRMQGLPSPTAKKIQSEAARLTGPQTNIRPKLEALEGNISLFPKIQEAQDSMSLFPKKMAGMQGLLSDAEVNFSTAKSDLNKAASERRSAVKAQNTAKITAATKAGEAQAYAKEFVDLEYPKAAAELEAAKKEFETLKARAGQPQPPPEANPKALKKQEADLLSREIDLEDQLEAARQTLSPTAKNAAAGQKAKDIQVAASARQQPIDEATEARTRARSDYVKAKSQLGKAQKDIEALDNEYTANSQFVTPFIQQTGLDPARMTPSARAALGVASQNPVTAKSMVHAIMHRSGGPAGELGDPTLARGLREALAHDPEALGAFRSEFVREIIDANRLQKGGHNFPRVFDGKAFQEHVNKFDSEAINQLFGDANGPSTSAADILKGLGSKAAAADQLAKPSWKMLAYGLGGAVPSGMMALSHGNLAGFATALGVGGLSAAIIDNMALMEKLLQSPGRKGRAIAAFLNSDSPEALPHNVVVEASKQLNSIFGSQGDKKTVIDPVQ